MDEEVKELLRSINTKLEDICIELSSMSAKCDDIYFIKTDLENIREKIK